MISAEFQPKLISSPSVVHTEDPYVKVEIWARDHSNIYKFPCTSWDKSNSQIYEREHLGATLVGLAGHRPSLTNANLTTKRYIKKEGLHWVLIRASRQPVNGNKFVKLYIDNKLVGQINTLTGYSEHYRYLDFGYLELNEGWHDFKIELDGLDAWVDYLQMYRLEYYSSDHRQSKYRLDWSEIEFTENSMGELNSADITLPLREEWNDPNLNIFSRKVFDFMDILNISVGSDWKDTRVKFGGYVLGIDENDDNTQITIHGVDRVVDFYRKPVYTNYYIGIAPSGDDTYTFPVVQFGSALESIRHCSETCEYGPLNYGILYPYTLNLDFTNPDDCNGVIANNGFNKAYSPSKGLRIGYDPLSYDGCGVVSNGNYYMTLWDNPDRPFDAAKDDILCLKYITSGESCGNDTRVQFNIEVTMHKAGETIANAKTYTILFTGKPGASNIIGQLKPTLNGIEQLGKFELKKAFDRYAPSSEYHVSKIVVRDPNVTTNQISFRKNSIIHLLGLTAYPSTLNKKMKVEQETSYPYEVINEILEKLEYVAWVDYGRTRATDIFMMSPEMNLQSPVQAVEGVNVLGVTDKSYAPYETIRNRHLMHYHYKEGDEDRTGISKYENLDSIARYGPGAWEDYEDATEINNQTDADIETKRHVEQNSYPLASFTIILKGTSLLNPAQYMVSKLAGHSLSGNYSTKTVTHSITREEGYISRVSVNRPGSYYNQVMGKLEKNLKTYLGINSRMMYNRATLNNMGFISVGAFGRRSC